jgi:hypothetical protein
MRLNRYVEREEDFSLPLEMTGELGIFNRGGREESP